MMAGYFAAQYDVLTACSGREALQKVTASPDLILLDINMPGMIVKHHGLFFQFSHDLLVDPHALRDIFHIARKLSGISRGACYAAGTLVGRRCKK